MLRWIPFACISSQYVSGYIYRSGFLESKGVRSTNLNFIGDSPSSETVSMTSPTGNMWKCLFFHTLTSVSGFFLKTRTNQTVIFANLTGENSQVACGLSCMKLYFIFFFCWYNMFIAFAEISFGLLTLSYWFMIVYYVLMKSVHCV